MHHKYTKDQCKFIADKVFGRSRKETTEMFNKHFMLDLGVNQITAYIKNHKLNTGRTGQFEKGHTPFNKGKKGISYGGEATQFKKGHRPHNYKPVGTEIVNDEGYIEVKTEDPRKWEFKHKKVWEEHNGPIPKGKAVIFGDGNKRNFDINNLILVSRYQLLILNTKKLIQNDADLTRTGVIIVDLYTKINQRKTKE